MAQILLEPEEPVEAPPPGPTDVAGPAEGLGQWLVEQAELDARAMP